MPASNAALPHPSSPAPGAVFVWLPIFLLGASAWVPHVPLWGPIGLEDLLPLIAVGLAAAFALHAPVARFDPLVLLLAGVLLLGFAANLFSGFTLDLVMLARGPGRTLFYLVLVVALGGLSRDSEPRRLLALLAVCAAVEAVIGIGLYAADYSGPFGIGLHRPGRGSSLFWTSPGRLVATFNLPSGRGMNGLAAYFGLFLPVTLALALTARGGARLMWAAGASAQAAALALTYTRSTLITLLAGVVAALWVWRRALILPVVALAGLALVASPELVGRFLGDSNDRLALIWAAVRMGAEAPWFGHGDIHYNTYLWAATERMQTPFGVAVTTPHNSLALAFFRYGLAGPLLVGGLLVVPVVHFWRRAGRHSGEARLFALAGLCAFVAFALQSLTNNLLEVPKIGIFFWILWVVLKHASNEGRGQVVEPP